MDFLTTMDPINDPGRSLYEMMNYTDSGYTPKEYVVPGAISQTHNQPRYGYTNDFNALLDGTSDEAKDYVLGVIIGAMIILIVAIVWFFAIICLKISGQKRVGFLAGRLVRPAVGGSARGAGDGVEKGGVEVVMTKGDAANDGGSGDGDVDEAVPVNSASNVATDDAARANKWFERRVWAVRVIFILSGLLVIISGGLFYGKGVVSFKNSLDEVRYGIDLVQVAAFKGINLTEALISDRDDLEEDVEPSRSVVQTNGEICGLDSELSELIRQTYDEFSSNWEDFKDMLDGSLESFSHDLRSLVALTEDIENSLDTADILFYVLVAISVIIICLIIAMLAGVLLAWRGIGNCLTRCVQYALIWPLFIFFLVLSWIFATLFLVVALGGADFCVDPDQYVATLLRRNGDKFDGIIFGFIVYYVSGCRIAPPGKDEIMEMANQLKLVLASLHFLMELVGELSIENIAAICGLQAGEAAALKTLTVVGHEATHVLNRGVVGMRDLLSCETFNPIYTTFVHDAFCIEGVSGLTYIFSTTLVISVFSMVMIMFRAALYPIREPTGAQSRTGSEDAMEVVEYNKNEKEEAAAGNSEDEDRPVIY